MKSTKKTNAARILDGLGIAYELKEYPVDLNDLSAVHAGSSGSCTGSEGCCSGTAKVLISFMNA